MDTSKFNYESNESKQMGGTKIVRKVSIRNGKGYKSLTKYRNGKKIGMSKKSINKGHIQLIKMGKFIPGLFMECKCKEKTRKNKK
jgi:hypothetical protein